MAFFILQCSPLRSKSQTWKGFHSWLQYNMSRRKTLLKIHHCSALENPDEIRWISISVILILLRKKVIGHQSCSLNVSIAPYFTLPTVVKIIIHYLQQHWYILSAAFIVWLHQVSNFSKEGFFCNLFRLIISFLSFILITSDA